MFHVITLKYAVSKDGGKEPCRVFFTRYRYFSLQHYTQTESGAQSLSWVLSLGRKQLKLQYRMYFRYLDDFRTELCGTHKKKIIK